MYQQEEPFREQVRFEMDAGISAGHFHPETEILYVLSGQLTAVVGNTSISLGPEDLILFNPYEHHELIQEAGCHFISLFMPVPVTAGARIGMLQCCSRLSRYQQEYFPLIRVKLAMLYRDLTDTEHDRHLYAQGNLYELLAILKEHFSAPEGEGKDPGASGEKSFRDVMMYVGEHFSEPVTVQDVADAVFLSRGYLTRLFRNRMNMSLSDYLQMLRLNKALRLLSCLQA